MRTPPLIFCGSSHPALGKEVASLLGTHLGKLSISLFPDGETHVEVLEDVYGKDVFVLQTVALDPNHYLMELLIIIDALKRASAKSVVVIIPYFGYCRQDRKDKPGEPITAKLVANLLTSAGTTRLITLDLHARQLEGFFEIPVDHILCQEVLMESVSHKIGKERVVVAPDLGSIKIAKKMATLLRADLALIEKNRINPHDVKMTLIGDVRGKDVLIGDDMCSTAGTLTAAASKCKEGGANRIFGAITHGLFVSDALDRIEKSPLDQVFATNTIPQNHTSPNKIITLSIAPLIANAIQQLLRT